MFLVLKILKKKEKKEWEKGWRKRARREGATERQTAKPNAARKGSVIHFAWSTSLFSVPPNGTGPTLGSCPLWASCHCTSVTGGRLWFTSFKACVQVYQQSDQLNLQINPFSFTCHCFTSYQLSLGCWLVIPGLQQQPPISPFLFFPFYVQSPHTWGAWTPVAPASVLPGLPDLSLGLFTSHRPSAETTSIPQKSLFPLPPGLLVGGSSFHLDFSLAGALLPLPTTLFGFLYRPYHLFMAVC